MTRQEFAGSVWHEAQTLALTVADDERDVVLHEWIRFAWWDDDFDRFIWEHVRRATTLASKLNYEPRRRSCSGSFVNARAGDGPPA